MQGSALKSDLLNVLTQRGYIHQVTDQDGLDSAAAQGPITAYIGFDATAPSLHVGSLVQIMMLRHLQKTGHKPIVLMGGGTTKIGDPTGKDESRKMLSDADIDGNIAGIKTVFENFLTFGNGPTDAVVVNNDDWLSQLEYVPFLREIGRHFTINRMLTFDSVRLRLEREQPMSFLEFNYMILQGYDFLELYRRHKCVLQMGGSDQWGNIVNGMELVRRVDSGSAYGLTTPLITLADGKKMGKTADGAVWLNDAQLPAYDYWQFWRNTQDADVGRFLKLFTDFPLEEIARLEELEGQEINDAKKILADEATALCRGIEAAKAAADTAKTVFEQGGAGGDLPHVDMPVGMPILDAFVALGLSKSKGEAKRLIQQGGAKINGAPITGIDAVLNAADVVDGAIKLSAGKKRHGLVSLV